MQLAGISVLMQEHVLAFTSPAGSCYIDTGEFTSRQKLEEEKKTEGNPDQLSTRQKTENDKNSRTTPRSKQMSILFIILTYSVLFCCIAPLSVINNCIICACVKHEPSELSVNNSILPTRSKSAEWKEQCLTFSRFLLFFFLKERFATSAVSLMLTYDYVINVSFFYHFTHFYPLVPSVCTTFPRALSSLPPAFPPVPRHVPFSLPCVPHSFISSPFFHLLSSPTSPSRSVIPPLFPRAAQSSASLSPVAS